MLWSIRLPDNYRLFATFPVDGVPASTEQLSTTALVHLARKKVGRDLLLSFLAQQRLVTWGSRSHAPVEAVHLAFSRNLPLTLSPDVLWLTLAQGFSHHLTRTPALSVTA